MSLKVRVDVEGVEEFLHDGENGLVLLHIAHAARFLDA